MSGMTYAGSGVDYGSMDPFKRACQLAGRETAEAIRSMGIQEEEWSRGESVYLQRWGDRFIAHVEEGLGSKNLVADAMYALTGKSYYDQTAQCNVAMVVNDLITCGALPTSFALHLAVGASDWFQDEKRYQDLIKGTAHACRLAGCAWGGGETSTLKGIICPDTALLSGSAVGFVWSDSVGYPTDLIRADKIEVGDVIILLLSSGIHANGLTLARQITDKLPEGYLSPMPDGRCYGEALLDPTTIYVDMIRACQKAKINLHYAVNITGHGWRKLMRAPQIFAYMIEQIPEPQPVFQFIQEHGQVEDSEMYGNYNMGAGFALYVAEKDEPAVSGIARLNDYQVIYAGHIEDCGEKLVSIQPKNLLYKADTLAVR